MVTVDPVFARDVVAALPALPGAYVHIPFCERICPFCPYNKVLLEPALAPRYFAALGSEVSRYVVHLDGPFTSLYIGGGTPSLFPERVAELVAAIPVTGERAVEVLPTHATRPLLGALADAGITRVSLGLQSFDDSMLRHLGRPNTAADNHAALEAVTGLFECVDVDLIFDAAFQDEAAFLGDVATCFAAGVEQVSTYPLMRFGFTPFGKAHHNRAIEHRVLRRVEELGHRHGYGRRTVWTFNRSGAPGYSSITRELTLGFGAGSASFTGREFLVNHFGVRTYIDSIEQGGLPLARRFVLGPLAAAAYGTFWQAYTGQVDTSRLSRLFGRRAAVVATAALGLAAMTPLARRRGTVVALTSTGFDVYHDLERWVTYNLIEPLWASMMDEHRAEQTGGPAGRSRGAGWLRRDATPRHSRWLWHAASRLFEQPLPTVAGSDPDPAIRGRPANPLSPEVAADRSRTRRPLSRTPEANASPSQRTPTGLPTAT